MKLSVPARIAAASVAGIVLAGCTYVNPITTQQNYAASDGMQLVGDQVEALNLIVISESAGAPATLLGTLVNGTDSDLLVNVSIDQLTVTPVDVPAGATVKLSPVDGDAEVTGTAPVAPGLLAELAFGVDADVYTVNAPVMDGTLPEYADTLDAIGE